MHIRHRSGLKNVALRHQTLQYCTIKKILRFIDRGVVCMYHLDFLLSIHLKSFEIANHKKDQRFFQARQDVETEVSPEDSSLGLVMAICFRSRLIECTTEAMCAGQSRSTRASESN